MIRILLVLAIILIPDYPSSHATTYDVDLMEQVSRNRELPIVNCMVSSPFHNKSVGRAWLFVISRTTGKMRLCRVTDTSQQVDIRRHQRNRLFEFDFPSWRALCGTSYVGEQPWRQCVIDVYVISEGYYDQSNSTRRNVSLRNIPQYVSLSRIPINEANLMRLLSLRRIIPVRILREYL